MKKLGRPRIHSPGPVQKLVFYMPRSQAKIIEQAAARAKMSISRYVGAIVTPVALNALQQETKVGEPNFTVS